MVWLTVISSFMLLSIVPHFKDIQLLVVQLFHQLGKFAGLIYCSYIPTYHFCSILWLQGIHLWDASLQLGLAVIHSSVRAPGMFHLVSDASDSLLSVVGFHGKVVIMRWGCQPNAEPSSLCRGLGNILGCVSPAHWLGGIFTHSSAQNSFNPGGQ